MTASRTQVESVDIMPILSVEDARRSTVLQPGLDHLLIGIAANTGLAVVLEEALPFVHEQVFAVATFLLARGGPVSSQWISQIAPEEYEQILLVMDKGSPAGKTVRCCCDGAFYFSWRCR